MPLRRRRDPRVGSAGKAEKRALPRKAKRLVERDQRGFGHRESRRLGHLQPLRSLHAALDPPIDLEEELVDEDVRRDLLQDAAMRVDEADVAAVGETRMVSPTPSMSNVPIPTALLIEPANGVPASVTPRCKGYGTFAASVRYARIIVGTCDALTLILKSWKSSFSSSSTCSSASTTSASAVSLRASSCRWSGSEPALAPIRIGMPLAFAAWTTSATLSGPPMLPGLMRTAATSAPIAFSASDALKWMSAITGIGDSRTSLGSAAASSFFGTATRAISQPAEASAAICAVVASTSCVFVSVIDCTATGAPPPIFTLPTVICLSLAMSLGYPARRRAVDAADEDARRR